MSDDVRAARHAEIERRYRRRDRPKPKSIAALRVRDLSRLYTARHGHQLPNDATGRMLAGIMVHHLAALSGDPRRRIAGWLELWCPWMPIADARELTAAAILNPKRWRADKLAWRLRLLERDRRALAITTIGAVDMDRAARAKRRRERARQRKLRLRRAHGSRPRAEYLAASASRARPWQIAGMSRAAWYRAGKPMPETSPATA